MKKGCIITLTDNSNLGNRLQNYALQKFLEKNFIDCDTLWLVDKKESIKKIITYRIKGFILHLTFWFSEKSRNKLIKRKRIEKITKFTVDYTKCRNIEKKKLNKIENDYEIFVFGSDQIWHPGVIKNNILASGDYIKHTKKISYAASFAVNELDKESKKIIKKCLKSFDKITVREDRGKEILNDILPEKKIEVVIDPTMLLPIEEWSKIEKKPQNLNDKKYILMYFLGKLSQKRKNEIKKIAMKNNCKIINILNIEDEFYTVDPREFIYLERNAFLICTDSFHSCIFAILFNRPFLIFNREDENEDMSSRFKTLLGKFNLENRICDSNNVNIELECDFTKANKILEIEREKSKKIIKNISS